MRLFRCALASLILAVMVPAPHALAQTMFYSTDAKFHTVPIAGGGTGQTTQAAGFNALSPMTTAGDIIYGGTDGAGARLAAGTSHTVFTGGTIPSWSPVLNFLFTGGIFSDGTPAANISRMDVLRVGEATVTSGTTANTPKDWVEALRTPSVSIATIAGVSPLSYVGVLGASRTSDHNSGMGSIGLYGLANNDDTVHAQGAWAHYAEAYRQAGVSGQTFAQELDMINLGSVVPQTPYNIIPAGVNVVSWLACGGAVSGAQPCSSALTVLNNGTTFDKGIVFEYNSLTSETGEAIALANGYKVAWHLTSGALGEYITGDNSGDIILDHASGSGVLIGYDTSFGGRLDIGSASSANTSTLNFHTSGYANAYDAKISATGGTSSSGFGSMTATGTFSQTGGFGYFGEYNTQGNPTQPSMPGLAISWNGSNGGGEIDLWNTFTTASQAFVFKQLTTSGSAHNDLATIFPDASLSIGNSTDAGAGGLDVNGQIYAPNMASVATTETGYVCWVAGSSPAGKLVYDTTTCLSSRREWKKDEQPLPAGSARAMLMALQPKTFEWRDPKGPNQAGLQIGMIAEDVEQAAPLLTSRDNEGKVHGWREDATVATLVTVVQDQERCLDSWKCRLFGYR